MPANISTNFCPNTFANISANISNAVSHSKPFFRTKCQTNTAPLYQSLLGRAQAHQRPNEHSNAASIAAPYTTANNSTNYFANSGTKHSTQLRTNASPVQQ